MVLEPEASNIGYLDPLGIMGAPHSISQGALGPELAGGALSHLSCSSEITAPHVSRTWATETGLLLRNLI